MQVKPGERMMGRLERRAEAISVDFNSQNIANTLWAFATMQVKPGERMMGQLERRAEAISGEFDSQNIANTMWAYCVMTMEMPMPIRVALQRRTQEILHTFTPVRATIVIWALSYSQIDAPMALAQKAAAAADVFSLFQMAESIRCHPAMHCDQHNMLSAALRKQLIGPTSLTLDEAVRIMSCLFESAQDQAVVDSLLDGVEKAYTDAIIAPVWVAKARCRRTGPCDTWQKWKPLYLATRAFRLTLSTGSWHKGIDGNHMSAAAEIFDIARPKTRAELMASARADTPGSQVMSTADVHRELNHFLHGIAPAIEKIHREARFLPQTRQNEYLITSKYLKSQPLRSVNAGRQSDNACGETHDAKHAQQQQVQLTAACDSGSMKMAQSPQGHEEHDGLTGAEQLRPLAELVQARKERRVNVTDKTQVKVPLDLAGVHKHAQPAAKTLQKRSHKGRAKKEKHVAGPEIQAKKIRQVSLTADAGKISRWAARETAREAREKAAYLAELEDVVAGARRKELERKERGTDKQNQAVHQKGPAAKSTGDGRCRKDTDLCGNGADVPPTEHISECEKRDANTELKKGATALRGLKGVQKRSHKGRAKKEKHVAGPEIQAKKIRQVSLTANAGKISRWAARETARQAREKAAYLAELEAVVAGARRKELERNQRTAGEQNPEAGNTAAALRRRDRTATKYRGVGFADDTQSQRQIGN
jgi:ribosomal protein L14E/L6E/L27E